MSSHHDYDHTPDPETAHLKPLCQHDTGRGTVSFRQLIDGETNVITGYQAVVEFACANCGIAFSIPGLPVGEELHIPTVNHDGTQLTIPLVPGPLPKERVHHATFEQN